MKKYLLLFLMVFSQMLSGLWGRDAAFLTPVTGADMSGYDVKWYFLDLQVNDTNTYITGSVTVMAQVVTESLPEMMLQLNESLQVDSVFVDGVKRGFTHVAEILTAPLDPVPARHELVTTTVFYHGVVQTGGFFSAMTSKEDTKWRQRVTWTLSEPFAAKDWFPCKQDLADKADSCAVWITVESGMAAGSNGVLAGVDTLDEGRLLRYRWHHRHPIDYYLISLAVSAYRTYDIYAHPQGAQDSLLVRNLIYGNGYLDSEKEKIDEVVPAIELYSELYGTYPFADEKYGHCLAPMGGGMEHQTMTTLDNFGFDMVVHELAHQWFGDHVTCASWQDIWINEGFASYSEYLSREYLKNKENADEWMSVAQARAMQETDGSVYVPLDGINDVYRIFNYNLSYKKGAAILHMIRYELNDDSLFFEVMRTFQHTYGDSVATGRDFENTLEQQSGMDFTPFFEQWYYGKGFPRYDISWYQNRDSLYIQSIQTPSGSTPLFKMHMDFLLEYDDGDTLVRLFQEHNNQLFVIPVKAPVWKVAPDPDKWLLTEVTSLSHVIGTTPGDADVVVYPNPASATVFVYPSFTIPKMIVDVYTLSGQRVASDNLTRSPYKLDISALVEGVYILQISSGNKKWVKKLIIRR